MVDLLYIFASRLPYIYYHYGNNIPRHQRLVRYKTR